MVAYLSLIKHKISTNINTLNDKPVHSQTKVCIANQSFFFYYNVFLLILKIKSLVITEKKTH